MPDATRHIPPRPRRSAPVPARWWFPWLTTPGQCSTRPNRARRAPPNIANGASHSATLAAARSLTERVVIHDPPKQNKACLNTTQLASPEPTGTCFALPGLGISRSASSKTQPCRPQERLSMTRFTRTQHALPNRAGARRSPSHSAPSKMLPCLSREWFRGPRLASP